MSAARDRAPDAPAAPAAGRGYFFVSYAHSAPPPSRAESLERDPSVAQFFSDLGQAVTAGSGRLPQGSEAGFYDQMLPPGADLKAELGRVLGQCEVFVPLYSPKYFETSWPLRELEAFRARVEDAGRTDDSHILPVLWTPFLSWKQPSLVEEAIEQGPAVTGYQERGLRALQWLSSYRASYLQVVEALAEKIVDLAENHPLGPSKAPDIDAVTTGHSSGPTFTVAFLTSPGQRSPVPDWWRPAEGTTVPRVAERAGEIVERLGLSTQITDLRVFPQSPPTTPTLVLVDPGAVTESESRFVGQAFGRLPNWVTTVLVRPEGEPAPALVTEAVNVIERTAKGPVRIVRDLSELAQVLPVLIARARRAYLRTTEVYLPETTTNGRPPRLGDASRWQSEEHEDD